MNSAEHFNKFQELENYGEISWEGTFDAGHRIPNHKGKCARLHGHTYHVHIMAAGEVNGETGFVVDFSDLKELVNEWDHQLLLWEEDPFLVAVCDATLGSGLLRIPDLSSGIVRLPFVPTAELMARYLANEAYLRFGLAGIMVELKETPKSMARYII
jgi:6-pyruvoyltetrahydropterin/6-carboxytetrahydropterin synthase